MFTLTFPHFWQLKFSIITSVFNFHFLIALFGESSSNIKKDWRTGQFTTLGFGDALRKNYNGLQHVTKSTKNSVLARIAVNLHPHGCKGFAFSKLHFLLLFQEKCIPNDPNLS